MKNRNILSKFYLCTILLVSLFIGVNNSFAFYVWTPKDKKPVNPKYAAKDTPQEQFDWAMQLFQEHDYKKAASEFVKLTEHFGDSELAPEAQYYAGRSFEELGKYYFAYENYQKTIENYPHTKRMEEILEREFNIAAIFQTKESPKLMDLELNDSLEKAITIYQKIVSNSTFGKYADRSLFEMADCYRRIRKYNEAVDTYDRLITDYPKSPLVAEAKYQMAYTTYEASLDPGYDQLSTDEALKKFEKISKTTAIPAIAENADTAIDILKNRKADSILKIAEFYEKQKKPESAVLYYRDIINKYPDSIAADIARDKVNILQDKVH